METNIKKQLKTDALSVARYLIFLDCKRDYFNTKRMKTRLSLTQIIKGNFRLNQTLYLLQILYHLNYKEILFDDKIYA
jgi:hypothetical protein